MFLHEKAAGKRIARGVFAPTMRIYSPGAEVMDGPWAPAPLKLREGVGAWALQ